MRATRGPLTRLVGIAIVIGGLAPMLGTPAHAVSPLPIACTAAGTVFFVDGNVDTWTLGGFGSCQGDLEGTYILQFTGAGTSDGGGLCSPAGVVTNLSIQITGSLTSAVDLSVKPLLMKWEAPLTTYPLGTPFLVTRSGSPIGAGVFWNHIFLNCSGSPAATFQFAFLT